MKSSKIYYYKIITPPTSKENPEIFFIKTREKLPSKKPILTDWDLPFEGYYITTIESWKVIDEKFTQGDEDWDVNFPVFKVDKIIPLTKEEFNLTILTLKVI